MTARKKAKPPGEMTTEEAAEKLFGKRVVKRVREELKRSEVPEKTEESEDDQPTKDKIPE